MDVRNATALEAVWDIISNTEALAVNRAWAGGSGTRLAAANTTVSFPFCGSQYPGGCTVPRWEVWAKPLPGGAAAVLILNHDNAGEAAAVAVPLAAVPGLVCGAAGGPCAVRDVWAHADNGTATGELQALVPAHDSVFLTLA